MRLDGDFAKDLEEAAGHALAALDALRGARIFLTGGTGFFGRWLIATLAHVHAKIGAEVVVLTRNAESFRALYPDLATHPAIGLHRGDVRDFAFPSGRFTHVIHAAVDTSVAADANKFELIETIVVGAKRVLEFSARAGAQRLLYVSSGAVYGAQPAEMTHFPEDCRGACDPLDPRSAYGEAKRLAELMCVCAAAQGGTPAVVARAFAFVGPGLPLDAHFAIGNFIRDAVAGGDIVVGGDGSPLRSYLYAGDLAAWLLTLLTKGTPGSAYNVGSDQAISIADLARKVASFAPRAPVVTIKGAAMPGAPRSRYVPAIARAQSLGLDVWTPLDEAIRRTMAFAQREGATAGKTPR
jgi:dTDP-glucose 4,6-dehydratase